MNARDAIARAEALGVRLRLEADGQVNLAAAAPPPADLLAELRLWREDVVRLLAERRRPAWADIAPEPPPICGSVPKRRNAPTSTRPRRPGDRAGGGGSRSGLNGAPILQTVARSSGAFWRREISTATGTPSRGSVSAACLSSAMDAYG